MSKFNQDARTSVTIAESVTMDSRKFLSVFNNSAESQVKFFSDSVRKLGEEQNANWRLAATAKSHIVIEDVDTGDYMIADYNRQKGGRITINNLKRIEITEGEKSSIFESACAALVESLDKGDTKGSESALDRIAANRFRSKSVPNSGLVRTRDGVVRHISVRTDVMNEEIQDDLVDRIVADLSDEITISEGNVSGTFSKEQIKLPISEFTTRRVVAYRTRDRALNANWSQNFQTLVESIAGHICSGKDGIKKIVPVVAEFLREQQEFSLLTREQLNEVVSNALAARGIFNESIVSDTTTLLYKTNYKINRLDIIDAWKKTAKRADHPVMLENAILLESASESEFPKKHEQFLATIFEAVGQTTREALKNGLGMLTDKITDPQAKQQLAELTAKLSDPATADDQTVWDGLNLMAKTQGRLDDMSDFDQMPGADAMGAGSELPAPDAPVEPPIAPATGGSGGGTVININTSGAAPSITGGGTPPPAAPVPAPESDDLLGSLDDVDLEAGGQQNDQGGQPAPDEELQLASLERSGSPLNEEETVSLEQAMGILDAIATDAGAEETVTESEVESDDEFVLPEGVAAAKVNPDYGVRVLSEFTMDQRIMDLDKIANEKKLRTEDIQAHLDELAGAALAGDQSLKDPKAMQQAKEELMGAYIQRKANAQRQAAGVVTPAVAENQIKSPTKVLARRGLKKAAINKLVTEGNLQFIKKEDKAIFGQYKGIPFVIDKTMEPAALLNFDARIEIPIPEGLVPGALYLSEMAEEEADADLFVEWLDKNIERLRPLTPEEEQQIQEAVAKLTVSPDVKVEISTTSGAPEVLNEVPEVPGAEGATEGGDVPAAGEGDEFEIPGEGTDENLEEALDKAIGKTLKECTECDNYPCTCKDCEKCKKKPGECKC